MCGKILFIQIFCFFFFAYSRAQEYPYFHALASRFAQRLSDSRSVPGCLALPMNICWRCPSVVLALKHLACTTRQQPQPRWQLNRLIISTQNSDVPHKHCGATLAFSLGIAEDVRQVIVVINRPQRSSWWKAAEIGCILVETKHLYCLPSCCTLILKRIECPECFIGV